MNLDHTPTAPIRYTGVSGYGNSDPAYSHPGRPIDAAALAEFTAGVERAVAANREREARERHREGIAGTRRP